MITAVAFFALLAFGLPIIFLLIFAALVFALEYDATILFDSFLVQSVKGIEANGFLAIPLYMLVGAVMNQGGITERLMRTALRLVGGLRGGLAYVNVLTNAFAAAILGSATAQIAIMTRTVVPEMVKQGYDKSYATGLTVATGLLGPIIPPSMLMIIYGVLAYQSVAALFIAGILPGLLVTFAFFGTVALLSGRTPETTDRSPPKTTRAELFLDVLPSIIPVVIIVGIVSGAMTPTEAGAVAIVVALALSIFVYRSIGWGDALPVMREVILASSSVVALIGFATLFGWVLSYESVPDLLAKAISSASVGPVSFLLLVCLLVFILGMFLDGIGVLIVLVPILLPLAQSFGVDPVHFGVVLAVATLTGLVSPPVGPGLYIAMDTTGLTMMQVFMAALPFLTAFVLSLLVVVALPGLSTFLPSYLGM
ncbi:MAG: TRAP transporter large permease [Pseudomonadota bacterium]